MVQRQSPDVILMDIKLPDADGLLLLAALRETAQRTLRAAYQYPPTPAADNVARIGPLVVDYVSHQVVLDGQPLALTPTEFRLLEASTPGPRIISLRGVGYRLDAPTPVTAPIVLFPSGEARAS